MTRRKTKTKPKSVAEGEADAVGDLALAAEQESRIFSGNASLHDLFQQQVRQTLDQSDLDDEAKQAILVALSCPCCGAGGMNYTAKIDRKKK
jgi:hypothetical protein